VALGARDSRRRGVNAIGQQGGLSGSMCRVDMPCEGGAEVGNGSIEGGGLGSWGEGGGRGGVLSVRRKQIARMTAVSGYKL
jgi:hypothetical protein